MTELTNDALAGLPAAVRTPQFDRSKARVGIAHFSVGNFHRAHQAVYLDDVLALPGQEGWGILGIGLMDDDRERAKARALAAQSGLYSLTECPPDGEPRVRVVGSILEYLHAPADPEAVLARLCDPAIRIVSMTVTEGGYNIDDATHRFKLDNPAVAADLADPTRPATVFGYVAEALARRRARGIAPFTVLSCDNLRHNGDAAAIAFTSYARARDAELGDWMAAHVAFPNCMVDRITPATLPADRERLNAASGIDDQAPIFAESFLQWVVEDKFSDGRPPLERVGVQITADVRDYEQVKLRMLNASHNMLCFPGLLIGYRTAHEAMADPLMRDLLDVFMTRDVAPLLADAAPADMDLDQYRRAVLARFGNPAIGDQLLRIASDGASKIPVFVQDTLRGVVAKGGDVSRLAFLVAAFVRYVGGHDDRGGTFPVVEPALTENDRALAAQPGLAPLGMSLFKGWGLERDVAFAAAFQAMRTRIAEDGARETLREVMGAPRPQD